jgi:hypothetical protein
MENELLSIRGFAKKVNLSESMIRKSIQLGKITLSQVGSSKGIIYEIGLKEIKEFAIGASKFIDVPNIPDLKSIKERKTNKSLVPEELPGGVIPLFVDSKKRSEYFKSELSRLALEARKGELVKKEDVYLELFEFGTALKNNILSIPDRITDQLISLSNNRNAFHNLLTDELLQSLEELSKYNQ